jgi:hypothetical protein
MTSGRLAIIVGFSGFGMEDMKTAGVHYDLET